MQEANTLIIGASMSGLASAAALHNKGIRYTIIEKEAKLAMPWRNHYDRLHLHTNKSLSNLPFKKFGKAIPRYPSRQQVVDYLEDYQKQFNIHPIFNTEAKSVKKEGEYWITETPSVLIKSKYVVIATGPYGKPKPIHSKEWNHFLAKSCIAMDIRQGEILQGEKYWSWVLGIQLAKSQLICMNKAPCHPCQCVHQ